MRNRGAVQEQATPPAPVSRELSRDEALRLLGNVTFGRIVFISRAMPALRIVAHVMDGDGLLIGLPYEPEIAALLRRVSGVVYEADLLDAATRLGWSVVLTGRAGLVEDPQELAQARVRLQAWPGELVDVVVRLRPELVTGFQVAAGSGAP
ncbi:pyridoxamine 5'-phosphate oxidase family protein [Nonomuraea sp. NPDC049784]|uniref:pyridoxamine 5'-phosphate oxidase family protein n=1 Tax=Nonomuraea sp. NPDC049784 TaxID=3154361 RepID=UPI0033CA5490